jgi:hypothetical protein
MNFPEAYQSNESIRFLYRANHIYVLFSALLNLVISLNFVLDSSGWKRTFQRIGSLLLLLSPFILIVAFFTEPVLGTADRPLTLIGIFLIFLGSISHIVAGYLQKHDDEH